MGSRMVGDEAGEMAGVVSCAMLWGLVFFGRLCGPLQNFKLLPFIGCATLASALNSLGLSLPVCQIGVG